MRKVILSLVAELYARQVLPRELCSKMMDALIEEPIRFVEHADTADAEYDLTRPSQETEGAAGFDLAAWIPEPITILPGDTKVIRTGWAVRLPAGVECQVRSRSGLAANRGVSVLNSPGTIDADYYPNDIKVILHNGGPEPFVVHNGLRIAQAVFARYESDAAGADVKGKKRTGGLGSTGV